MRYFMASDDRVPFCQFAWPPPLWSCCSALQPFPLPLAIQTIGKIQVLPKLDRISRSLSHAPHFSAVRPITVVNLCVHVPISHCHLRLFPPQHSYHPFHRSIFSPVRKSFLYSVSTEASLILPISLTFLTLNVSCSPSRLMMSSPLEETSSKAQNDSPCRLSAAAPLVSPVSCPVLAESRNPLRAIPVLCSSRTR